MAEYSQGQVAELIRRRLQRHGLTQAELAVDLGVSEPFVSLVLNGQRRPTGRLLKWLGLEQIVTYKYRRRTQRRTSNGGEQR